MSKRFCKLCWILLEAKIKYYLYPTINNISDSLYDRLEQMYVRHCNKYNYPNTIQSMVGVDLSRESVQIAVSKIFH